MNRNFAALSQDVRRWGWLGLLVLAVNGLAPSIVGAAPPQILATDPPPAAVYGEPYVYDFEVDVSAEMIWVVGLPPGLNHASSTSIQGTPTLPGEYDVVIHAKGFDGEENEVIRRIVVGLPEDLSEPEIEIVEATVRHRGGKLYEFAFHFQASDDVGVAGVEYRGAVNGGSFDGWRSYPYLGPDMPFPILLNCTAFDFEVRAVDFAGKRSAAEHYRFRAPVQKPAIKGARPPRGQVGKPYFYRISAPGTVKFRAGGLPRGLRLNGSTGTIRGVPRRPGSYSIRIEARNAGGVSKKTFKLRIAG